MQLGFEALEAWKNTYLDEMVHFELWMTKKSAVEIRAEFETATENDRRKHLRPAPAPGKEDGLQQGATNLLRQGGVFCYLLIPVGPIWEAQGLWDVLVDLKVPVTQSFHRVYSSTRPSRDITSVKGILRVEVVLARCLDKLSGATDAFPEKIAEC